MSPLRSGARPRIVVLTGAGRFQIKTGQMLSFVWVFDGIYKGAPPYDQPAVYNGVVEWVRE